jgi:PAS domain S-box-containing protein
MHAELNAGMVTYQGKPADLVIIRDITERNRAEKELYDTLIKYKTLFNCFPLGITVSDEGGKILESNLMAERLLGVSQEEHGQRGIDSPEWRIIRPDGTPMPSDEYASVRALREKRTVENVEMGIIKPDNTITWISVTASPLPLEGHGVTITFGDITERKRAEEAMRKSEEKYRSLTENINLGIYRNTAGPEGKFIEANPAIIKMFGYKSKEEFLSSNVLDLYQNPEDRNRFNDKMLKEGFVRGEELRLKKKDGSPFIGSVSAVTVKDKQGHAGYYDGIIEDITERKRTEEELRKSESQLRALSLELSFIEERERKRLASYLHDEIGQSLALLRMKFGSLTGIWGSKSRKQNIQQIRDLLEEVIDQTHTLTFELSPPVLHQLGLEAAIEWAGEKISQDFGIEFMFSDDGMIKPLSADIKALLFRCVRELMSNTVKHAKAKRMTVSLTRREERVFVVVEDDGVGFDISLSGRPTEKVGFGLFSVRERFGAVGGSYEFQSEPGQGTRITLSVPLKEEMPSS